MAAKNGRDIGAGYLEKLQRFKTENGNMPCSRPGVPNITELSRMTAIPKCTFYQNLPVKHYLDSWLKEINLSRAQNQPSPRHAARTPNQEKSEPTFDEERGTRRTERELHHANQLIAVLTADNHHLRERVADLEMDAARIDFIISTGFRV